MLPAADGGAKNPARAWKHGSTPDEQYSLLEDGGAAASEAVREARHPEGFGPLADQFHECEENLARGNDPGEDSVASSSLPSTMAMPLLSSSTAETATSSMVSLVPSVPERGDQEPQDTAVVIEMQSIAAGDEGKEEDAAGGSPAEKSPHPRRVQDDCQRACFICLQDGDKDNVLIPCCTTCYACTHVRCWREWRNNQRTTALRSRLLGLRMQSNHLLRCTICKSGTAVLDGKEDGLDWMNDIFASNEGSGGGRAAGIQAQREDSDEDNDAQFEDLIDMKTCLALVVYLGVLALVLLVACVLIIMQRFYAGDVVLCCIITLYELSVLQIVSLTVARQRGVMVAAAVSRESGREEEGGQQAGHDAQGLV